MAIAPIPLKTVIVDKAGAIVIFFRQRWEELRTVTGLVAAKAIYQNPAALNAALVTQLLYTVLVPGLYEITFSARRTSVDGAASSLQFTGHWTDGGAPLSFQFPVNNTDTTGSLYTGTMAVPVDVNTNLTFDMAYTSTTPGAMKYKLQVSAKLVTQV